MSPPERHVRVCPDFYMSDRHVIRECKECTRLAVEDRVNKKLKKLSKAVNKLQLLPKVKRGAYWEK